MKNLLLIILTFLLIGCSSYDIFQLKQKSGIEYVVSSGNRIVEAQACKNVLTGYTYGETGNFRLECEMLWELLYIGKENNSIRLLYREYLVYDDNSYIKSDYTIEYKYDLSESKIIKFKDINLTIKKADASEITYLIN